MCYPAPIPHHTRLLDSHQLTTLKPHLLCRTQKRKERHNNGEF